MLRCELQRTYPEPFEKTLSDLRNDPVRFADECLHSMQSMRTLGMPRDIEPQNGAQSKGLLVARGVQCLWQAYEQFEMAANGGASLTSSFSACLLGM